MVRLEEIVIVMPYEDVLTGDRSHDGWGGKTPAEALGRPILGCQERSSPCLPSSCGGGAEVYRYHKAPALISYCQRAPVGLP